MAVTLLIFPDFQLLDAAGPISAFEIADRHLGRRPQLRIVAETAGMVASSSGVALAAEGLPAHGDLDTLLIAGGEGTAAAMASPAVRDFVRAAASRSRRVASVCSGAYILAAAGLLDGRRATTHWGRSRHFARSFPQVKLEPDRIFVRDGDVWTSAGITAGIDLALALIEADHGADIARATARQLVVYFRRPGGQSQFSALNDIAETGGRFTRLLGWAREQLGRPLTVEMLASEAGMSTRHFARAFAAETGMTPAKAIERLRLDAARARVESAGEPIEIIARKTGFNDPERMRRAFVRAFGLPPQAMRRSALNATSAGSAGAT